MRYHILKRIKAEDNLAQLFNAYMKKLSMLDSMVMPRGSMREYNQNVEALLRAKKRTELFKRAHHMFHFAMPNFFHLQLLSNSLGELHSNVAGAIEKLEKLFTVYEGDTKRYAIEERLACLEEYGSDDDSDWEENGVDAEGAPQWKAVYKEDEESLKQYSIQQDLNQYFPTDDTRGELIGMSDASDYALFSNMVENATALSPFKMMRAVTGAELPMYKQTEDGQMVTQTLADEVESEINEDLRNQSIVAYFRQVMEACKHAAALQAFAHSATNYHELYTHLVAIRNVDLGASTITGHAA